MRKSTILLFSVLFTIILYSDVLVEWEYIWGGSGNDYVESVLPVPGGGYFIVGITESFGGADNDIWILRLNAYGDSLWSRLYDTSEENYVIDAFLTDDNGLFILASVAPDGNDYWFIVTDSLADTIFTNSFNTAASGDIEAAIRTSDNTFACTGTCINGGPLHEDFYFCELSDSGDVLRENSIHMGDSFENGLTINETHDGGFIIGGFADDRLFYIFTKLDSLGDTVWTTAYTDTIYSHCFLNLIECSSTDYYMAGADYSDGCLLLKIDTLGNIIQADSIISDDSYIIAIDDYFDGIVFAGSNVIMNVFNNGIVSYIDTLSLLDDNSVFTGKSMGWNEFIFGGSYYYFATNTYDFHVFKTVFDMGINNEFSDNTIPGFNNINQLLLFSDEARQTDLNIYDISGRQIMNKSIFLNKGTNNIDVDLPIGLYFIKTDNSVISNSGKLIIIR